MSTDIPDPIADDAPTPDEVDSDSVDRSVRIQGQRWIGATHDGEVYCLDCISEEYLRFGIEDPYQIPYGGPYPLGTEVDCPGSSCGHCLRRLEGATVLHYDGVCDPFSCPDMAVRVADPDGVREPVEAALLERDGGDVRIMLREDFGSHGDVGDESWIPESDLRKHD